MHRAAQAALSHPGGPDLGFDIGTVRWCGYGGMRWGDFHRRVTTLLDSRGPPVIMVVHLGGNDLAQLRLGQLNLIIQVAFQWLKEQCPNTTLVFSGILPRREYRGALSNKNIDNCRRACNRHARRVMGHVSGGFIAHPQFSYRTPALFAQDGVHLSPEGNLVFLNNITQVLREMARGRF